MAVETIPITLEELLQSRDNRRATQLLLLDRHPGKTLIVVTVVIPGNVKRSPDSIAIGKAACAAIDEALPGAMQMEVKDLNTGFEAYYLSDIIPSEVKSVTSHIEDTHPLGRMMDIDVLDPEGRQISRADKGEPLRKCLICGNIARVCMRAFTHTTEELLAEIHRRVTVYQNAQR